MQFHANTTLFTLQVKRSYTLQLSSGHPRGVLIHSVRQIISRCKYQIKEQRIVRCMAVE
jgi:hypothetical protein